MEHDGQLKTEPNRGAVVPVTSAADVLEVYAMRASLGSLAFDKLMRGDSELAIGALQRELRRFERAVARDKAPAAADAHLQYQSTIVDSAPLPRVSRQFDRLTWQVRIFIATLGVSYGPKLTEMLDVVSALHAAIIDRNRVLAERLWREKFERWVIDFVDWMDEGFDRDLWAALTSGAGTGNPAVPRASPQPRTGNA